MRRSSVPTSMRQGLGAVKGAGAAGVGLLVAIYWKGIGELIGGLVVLGAVAVFVVNGALNVGLQLGALTAIAPFALVGSLFVACGWYALAQRLHHAPHAMACHL